jgi:hypothetical protein
MAFGQYFLPPDLTTSRYTKYPSLCPSARPSHLFRVDGPPDDGPLGEGSPDKNFPDDGLPHVGLPEVGLQDKFRQGKVAELRQELNSGGKKDKNHSAKKITLKKIVANMTMSNNDMVALFPDIVNCMQIPSLEIKKMYEHHGSVQLFGLDANLALRCFLYLVNYAKMKPDVALKALPILLEVRLPQLIHSNLGLTIV